MDKNKKYLLAAMLIALSLRIGYILTLEDKLYFPDSFRYYNIGVDLAEGRGYNSAFTAPLYPLFLGGIHRVFGDSYLSVRIIQSLVSTASVLLIYLLGRALFSGKVGLMASFISAFYPFFIFFTGLLLTETLFMFLFLSLVYLLQRTASATKIGGQVAAKKISYAVGAGVVSGLCILIKPLVAYFLPFAFLIFLVAYGNKRAVIGYGFLIMMLAGIVLSPWVIRNYQRFGKFIPLTTGGGITLYESNNPRATGGPGYENIVWTKEMKEMDEIELDKYFRREAIKFIFGHPRKFLWLSLVKFKRFWSFVPNAEEYTSPLYKVVSLLSYGPVILLAVWGMIAGRRRWPELMILYLPIACFLLVHLVILGSVRYRLPITPYLILFAGYGVTVLAHKLRGVS